MRCLIAAAVVMGFAATACAADKGWVGLPNLCDLTQLQNLDTGLWAVGASSRDRGGGNDDQGNYLYASGPEYVMLDEVGAGCVYRLWCTAVDLSSVFRFYFDGESAPRKAITAAQLFSGVVSPFLSPLVGNDTVSSGGFYCYLPMPFRTGCKITTTEPNLYYNVSLHRYTDSNGVATWTGSEDSSDARAVWNAVGADPKPGGNPTAYQGSISIPARSSATLIDVSGPGTVTRILIDIPQIVPGDALSDLLLGHVWIKAYWDDSPAPQVCAPLGLFFGSGLGECNSPSVPVGMYVDGRSYYCYFPMSFASRARIEIVNKFSSPVSSLHYLVDVVDEPGMAQKIASGQVGRFHARHYKESALRFGRDYCILDTVGRGKMVGCVVSMKGETVRHYLEGDERFYIDGSSTPAVYGTGTEDYFNGGWYFNRGTFALPVHGNPAHKADASYDYTSCYRMHLSDTINYDASVRLGLEHGPANDRGSGYESVVYYYQTPRLGLLLTDGLDVGDLEDEARHSYEVDSQSGSGMYYRCYEGDNDDVSVLDHGRAFTGYSQFTLRLNPANTGARLMRRMDYSVPNVRGEVFVDGSHAGTWYEAGSNTAKAWRDTLFEIPAALTAGKSRITVRINNSGSSPFNEYFYWVYSRVDTPGLRLELEDFDSCYDTTPGNVTGCYRDEDADIDYCSEGGYCITAAMPGEWLQFDSVEFPAGLYNVSVRHNNEYGDKQCRIEIDGADAFGPIGLPTTSGIGVWYTTSAGPVWIDSGSRQVRFITDSSSVGFNYIEFVRTLDLDPPQSFVPVADPSGWTSGPISISFDTADAPGGWGMSHYEGKIGGGPFNTVTSPWVIEPGQMPTGPCEVLIRAFDRAGNYREASVQVRCAVSPESVAQVKALPDGTWAMISGKTVTAVYADSFYIQEADRTEGIRVLSTVVPAEADAPELVGMLSTVAGERVLDCR